MPLPTTAARTSAAVSVLETDDGLLVRLSGALTARDVPALRRALLRPGPPALVVVDAGRVRSVDDAALATLLAATVWTADGGGRLLFSTLSTALAAAVAELDPRAAVPLLPAPVPPAANVRALRPISSEIRVVA